LRDQARVAAHRADLGIGVGATLLVSAVVLYWLSPSPATATSAAPAFSLRVARGVGAEWHTAF
jgi:hypothetical protein